jgi:hypothetical protein
MRYGKDRGSSVFEGWFSACARPFHLKVEATAGNGLLTWPGATARITLDPSTRRRTRMRIRVLPAALVVLACAAPVFAQATNKPANEKLLIANENKINEAVAKGDVNTFNSLLAPEAVSGDGMTGFVKASDFGKTLGQLKITSWHIMNPQVVWIDDKSAVVAYTWMGAGTYQGKPVPDQTIASTVWTERNGKWVAVFHQESTLGPPPPSAPPAPAKKK